MRLLKAISLWILQGILGAILAAFIVMMFLEWSVGCGETYIDSKGVRHQNQCLFINQPKETQ